MAWANSTPGSGGRAATPTVFEQQREELVREIAVVCLTLRSVLLQLLQLLMFLLGYGTGASEYE